MVIASPLADPGSHPWLAEFAGDPLVWWLLRGGDGPAEVNDALAALLPRLGGATGEWLGRAEGPTDWVSYVRGSAPGGRRAGGRGPRTSTTLGPASAAQATSILDRAETAGVIVLLALREAPQEAEHHPALPTASAPAAAVAVVLRPPTDGTPATDSWAVIGSLTASLPAVLGLSTGSSAAQLPQPPAAEAPRPARRLGRGAVATLLLLAAVAAAVLLQVARLRPDSRHPGVTGAQLAASPPTAVVPQPEYQPALAFDATRHAALLFGGHQPGPATWLLKGKRWVSVAARQSPADRFGSAMAFDPLQHRLVLFGGRELDGPVTNDTWSWDGRSWTYLPSPGPRPPADEFAGMAWDAAHRQMVLVTPAGANAASASSVTWTLGPDGWVRVASAAAGNPPAEPSSAMVFDPATRSVLLALSGLSPGAMPSTWSWNGSAWRELHPPHEPHLGGFLSYLAPDPGRAVSVLLRPNVGSPQVIETWTWNGSDWTQQVTGVAPTFPVALFADTAGAVTAVGRDARTRGLTAAWTWNGSAWRRVSLHATAG